MRLAAFALSLVAVASCGDAKRADRPALVHPNVLLLVMDTARADRCSVQGYERPTTPALASFARDAVVFADAWSSSNWTAPAHATLFTGLGPDRHGLHGGGRLFLRPDLPTLAERFVAAGYDTGCFTNNEVVSPQLGLTRGFAKFEPLYLDENRPLPWARDAHARAAQWAEASHAAGRPFFLFINDVEPHQPYRVTEEDAAEFVRGTPSRAAITEAAGVPGPLALQFDLGSDAMSAARLALQSDLYDAAMRTLDREIGVLLDRLRTDGLLDSTIVAVVGDHGEFLGEHHIIGHAYGLYRQVLRVPLLLRYPGSFDGGRVVQDVVRLEDLPATLTEMCGLTPLPGAQGTPLTSGVAGRLARAMQPPHDRVSQRAATEFPQADVSMLARGMRSVFDGKLHLITSSDGHVELYDVARDPDETDDLAARSPAEVARLTDLLQPPR